VLLLLALLGFDRLGQGSTRFVAAHPVLRALSSCYTTWISQFLSSLFLAALFLPPYFYRLIFTALFSPSYFYSLTFTVLFSPSFRQSSGASLIKVAMMTIGPNR
jgi:hypothetical protein